MPDNGRSISENVAHLNILIHDMINLLYYNNSLVFETLPLTPLGFLTVCFPKVVVVERDWGGRRAGGWNYPPYLKFFRIMAETWNLVRKYTNIYSFRKKYLLIERPPWFCWCQQFLAKIVHLPKAIVWELCFRLFSSVLRFWKIKRFCYWKYKFYRPYVWNLASGWLQIGHKLEKR